MVPAIEKTHADDAERTRTLRELEAHRSTVWAGWFPPCSRWRRWTPGHSACRRCTWTPPAWRTTRFRHLPPHWTCTTSPATRSTPRKARRSPEMPRGRPRRSENVLKNCMEHTPAGGTIRVEVRGRTRSRCRIRVTDTGPGIAAGRPAARLRALLSGRAGGTCRTGRCAGRRSGRRAAGAGHRRTHLPGAAGTRRLPVGAGLRYRAGAGAVARFGPKGHAAGLERARRRCALRHDVPQDERLGRGAPHASRRAHGPAARAPPPARIPP